MQDWISRRTGYAAVKTPARIVLDSEAHLLDVPTYWQIDSYSCGAVAGFMIAKTFNKKLRFEKFYGEVNPHPIKGTSTTKLIGTLRKFKIGVSQRHDLTFAQICEEINKGYPIVTCVNGLMGDYDHWTVIYGYSERPNCVFLKNNFERSFGIPLPQAKFAWKDFRRRWMPVGNGLVCWGIKIH
ncbi:MAG: cysteine peptidase family C39 domain-containing protein [Verrucomicrobiota bacterium]|nr:cysteine peptidase family C39 domain-containing protein [Verrucomicrobiota bacterium]